MEEDNTNIIIQDKSMPNESEKESNLENFEALVEEFDHSEDEQDKGKLLQRKALILISACLELG